MSTPQDIEAVIHLDLRAKAAELDSPAALRARVARQLGAAGLPEPDDPLFLVVDTPAGLTDHQRQYELLTGFRAVGEVRLLVLLVGSAPGSYAGEDEAFRPDRRLVRPAVLRTSGTALLWAGDLRSARTALEQAGPDDPDALAVLVGVLSVPDLYRRVLDTVGALPEAVAAPGVRLLEQDLPPEVRERAWRDALTRFAGEDTELAPDVHPADPATAELPEPLRVLAALGGDRDQQHRDSGGRADGIYRACAHALTRAQEALTGLQGLPGLLRPARRATFEVDVEEAREALEAYRELVGAALRGAGTGLPAAEAAARLRALGLRVPSAEGVGERIGEGLKEFAGKLLDQGLPMRTVAQRFAGLAGWVAPVPGSTLLPQLADLTPGRTDADDDTHAARRADAGARSSGGAGTLARGHPLASVSAGFAGLSGALWQGPLLALAVVVPLLFTAVALLGAARLRGSGRPGRWAVGPRVGAFVGAAVGAGVALATAPPVWLGTAALLLGLGVTGETARRLWRAAAAAWAPGRAITGLRRHLDELDGLLAAAVREQWAVEERLYCADAARSVAGMLRATAAAAESEAGSEPARTPASDAVDGPAVGAPAEDDWLDDPSALEPDEGFASDDAEGDWASAYAWQEGASWDDEPADEEGPLPLKVPEQRSGRAGSDAPWEGRTERVPRWLERESGEGGPELVATLAADLADAAREAMKPYWRAVERGQAGTLAVRRTEERVHELLSAARNHLRHSGVLAPPPFAARRARGSAASLLGTDPYRPAELVGAEADRQAVVQLSSPEQGTLLSRDPGAAVWVRFAPRAVRDEVEKAWRSSGVVAPEGVLWTSSGRYAGLVRLTPLRMGVVDTFRPRQGSVPGAGTDADPEAYDLTGPRGPADSYDGPDPYDRAEATYDRGTPYDRTDRTYDDTDPYEEPQRPYGEPRPSDGTGSPDRPGPDRRGESDPW